MPGRVNPGCPKGSNTRGFSNDYQTVYIPFNRKLNTWGFNVPAEKNYLWISSNDGNAKREGWQLTFKNLRMLTVAEATEECKKNTVNGSIADAFTLPNADFSKDTDPDMDGGSDIYARAGGNPILQSGNLVKPLPDGYTTFNFDYKLTGESFAPKVYLHKNAAFTEMTVAAMPDDLVLEGTPEDNIYESDWKTFSIDLSKEIEEIGFANVFGSNHFLWVQCQKLGESQSLYIKNVRWTKAGGSEVETPVGYPIYFRDAGNIVDKKIVPENGGHFEFPIDEDGNPVFNEDGSITATVNKYGESGIWLRTKALTENCPEEYNVFAFDYKSNRDVNNLVIFHHEYAGRNDVDQINGALISVADDYQTVYIPFNRKLNTWGFNVPAEKNYLWISSNDGNAKAEGWELTFKNLRMLTTEQAAADCNKKPVTGDIADAFTLPNGDFAKDLDPDMDGGSYVYARNGGNPILQSGNLVKPLPAGYTTFCFDYKYNGEAFAPKVYLHKNAAFTEMTAAAMPDGLKIENTPDDELYTAEWKTFAIDLAKEIENIGFANVFGTNHFLWVQCQQIGEEKSLYVKNPRWTNTSTSAIEDITIAPARPADNRIFNLLGIECKAPLAPGIYIQNGKKFIVK